MKRPYLFSLVAGITLATALTACGGNGADPDKPRVVASTDVWGNVAQTVAGPDAQVSAIFKDAQADPHSFDPSARDRADLSDADLIVYNGGDYDPFASKALEGKPDKKRVNAFDVRVRPDDKNEHIWYDIATTTKVAAQIADRLAELDPGHAQGYRDRAAAFGSKLNAITAITSQIAAQRPHSPVAQTEPIAHYLLTAASTHDLTPAEFTEAIEQGTDPAPAALAATRELLAGKKVKALVYNAQTSDKVAADLKNTAATAGVKVVEVTETLPSGLDYIQWQTRNAQALAAALG